MEEKLDRFINKLSLSNKIGRLLWNITWIFLFRPFGTRFFRLWRIFLLRLFGAKVSWKANVYSSVRIWAPWNLTMKDHSCIAQHVILHNVSMVTLCFGSMISEGCFLTPGTHDIRSHGHEMYGKPITIGAYSWIAVQAFIGVGVTVGEGAVVGARAAVFKDVEPWTVVGGNPAKVIGKRVFKDEDN